MPFTLPLSYRLSVQSVRKGFRIEEIEALARRAGLDWLRVTSHFGHRFTLAGERRMG